MENSFDALVFNERCFVEKDTRGGALWRGRIPGGRSFGTRAVSRRASGEESNEPASGDEPRDVARRALGNKRELDD